MFLSPTVKTKKIVVKKIYKIYDRKCIKIIKYIGQDCRDNINLVIKCQVFKIKL